MSLRSFLDNQAKHFEPGGKLEKLHTLWEAQDTILYTPGKVTTGPSHVRDGLDLKRMMMTVVIALIPAIAMAMYNTGYQAHLAISRGAEPLARWQTSAMEAMGLAFDPGNLWACVVHGSLYFFPVLIMTFVAGGFWEVLFASIRRHEVNEGFFVTGFLFPLILPATIPLWQVAMGISFGVVLGKEIFGGTGMNFLTRRFCHVRFSSSPIQVRSPVTRSGSRPRPVPTVSVALPGWQSPPNRARRSWHRE